MGLINWGMEKYNKLDVWGLGAFKLSMFTFGLLVGAYASVFVKSYDWLFGLIFIASLAWLLFAMFRK